MERTDLLKREDNVTITVWGPRNENLYSYTGEGYHTIESAVEDVLGRANLGISPEDCVFEVANNTTGVTHRYRLNAHGNLKLII